MSWVFRKPEGYESSVALYQCKTEVRPHLWIVLCLVYEFVAHNFWRQTEDPRSIQTVRGTLTKEAKIYDSLFPWMNHKRQCFSL